MRQILGLILLSATGAGASTSAFQLGINYSEWLSFPTNGGAQLATDPFGAAYFLTTTLQSNVALSTVTKLTPDGKTLLWQNQLGFAASAMTVDPNGGVYVIPVRQPSESTAYVAKLSTTGTGLAWKTSVGFLPQSPPAIAADSQGRAYLTAQYAVNNFITRSAYVVRLNASGSAIDFTTQMMGTPTSIALDPSGAAYIVGSAVDIQGAATGFLAKVASDGTAGYYTLLPTGLSQTVAVDANGNVVLFGGFTPGVVQRIDSNGAVAVKTTVPGPAVAFALDAAGNAYVAAVTNQLYPVRNSLATCGFDPATTLTSYSELLNVIAPDGSLLQATYIPGGDNLGSPLLAVTPNGMVLVAATAGPAFSPTQTGPFPAGPFPAGTTGGMFLSNLSSTLSNSSTPIYSLTCAGSSASLTLGSISPGELVTLFGNGLGPQQGVETHVAPPNPYPTKMASVEVTFDGTPAPLLWVQDAQINLVAPWSLTPGRNTQICVSYNTVNTNCLTLPVAQATPAVFMADGRYAAALNQNGTYNSAGNPAAPGSIVTVYATGLGPITPSQPEGSTIGQPLPTNVFAFGVEAIYTVGSFTPIEVDVPFEVQYAGPAPTLVGGVSQINFRIAPYASFGAIYLHLGSIFSPGFSIHVAGQ
ncbi:MAG: hypothetical protein M3N54_13250 [Acidobacteriota bacterium]|nr:hypothetical protein [Acidobacteriota bacterium]